MRRTKSVGYETDTHTLPSPCFLGFLALKCHFGFLWYSLNTGNTAHSAHLCEQLRREGTYVTKSVSQLTSQVLPYKDGLSLGVDS